MLSSSMPSSSREMFDDTITNKNHVEQQWPDVLPIQPLIVLALHLAVMKDGFTR